MRKESILDTKIREVDYALAHLDLLHLVTPGGKRVYVRLGVRVTPSMLCGILVAAYFSEETMREFWDMVDASFVNVF